MRSSGTKKSGFSEGDFCKMYTSLGYGAVRAKCTAGPNLFVSLAVTLDSAETPFAKTPFSFRVPGGNHPRGTTLPRLSEEIRLSEGSQGPLRGSLRGFCRVPAGLCEGPRDFPRVVILSL